MKLTPKTKLGKWSIFLMVLFFAFLVIFFIFIALGERGGETYFSNLKLAIPGTLAWLSAITSFFVGAISVKKGERAVLVYLSILVGFLILLWILAEIVFPH